MSFSFSDGVLASSVDLGRFLLRFELLYAYRHLNSYSSWI